jgi:Ni/Co efflux regulator RcnB
MKRMIIAGMVLSLLVSALALADPPPWAGHHDGGEHREWNHEDHRDDRDHRDWRERRDWGERHDWRREHDDEGWRARRWGDFDDGAYRRPPGYYSRVWRRGERLPIAYRAPAYIIPDAAYYHLAPPPPGYYWVRVDGDAVLAAVATGVVADVIAHEFH